MSEERLVTIDEIDRAKQSIELLQSYVKSNRFDAKYMARQYEHLHDLLDRINSQIQRQEKAGRFEALYNVSSMLGSSLNINIVLDQVMDAVLNLTGAERGFLMLRNDDGGLEVTTARNLDQQSLQSGDFLYSRTIANYALDHEEAIVTTNASEDPRFAGQQSIMVGALRSIMATPLRARGNVIGVAYIDSRLSTDLFNEDDLNTLEAFSAQAAVAIDNALLFNQQDEELARRIDELQQLRRMDLQLNEILDPENSMTQTLEWACRLSGASIGYLILLNEQQEEITSTHYYHSRETGILTQPIDQDFPQIWQVAHDKKPIIVDGELLIVPVIRENKTIGVGVFKSNGQTSFTEYEQDLMERVLARAAVAIENSRLYQAVQDANRAKSEFVSVAAHELKAPMTSISGYADLMLMDGGLDGSQEDFLWRIRHTVDRMGILVSDLADISRIESGHFLMNAMRVKIADVIQAVQDTTLPEMERRNHRFIIDAVDNLPDLYIDYYRLLQVLTNFVSNAYKYTPDGGTITLFVKPIRNRIQFSVQDTGIGLSEQAIHQLGTKFWRAEDEYTRTQPGTGLGFAITKSLVEQMGSQIEIESKLGKGSTFTFYVPIMQEGS